MDRSVYKTIATKRGFKYAYASIPAEGTSQDTLLFVHGFPSSSYDWRKQVDFFRKAGFSLIIPDMLGAGETEKPVDWTVFELKAMAADVIDILDAEKVAKVVLIGHDWFVSLDTFGTSSRHADVWAPGAAFLCRGLQSTTPNVSRPMLSSPQGSRRFPLASTGRQVWA